MSIKINFRLLILLLGTLSFFSCFTHNKPEKIAIDSLEDPDVASSNIKNNYRFQSKYSPFPANDDIKESEIIEFNDIEFDEMLQSINLNDSLIKLLNKKNLYYEQLLSELNNKISLLEERSHYIDSTNSKIYLSLISIEDNINMLSTTYNEIAQISYTNDIKDIPPMTDEDFKDKYIESLAFYQNGEWEKSLEGFKYLLTIGANNDLLDNCQYWLGEIYYKLKKYHFAIEEFKKVFLYTDSNKIDDALYKLSKSYSHLGDEVNSNKVLVELVENHHNSEYVKKAKELLK